MITTCGNACVRTFSSQGACPTTNAGQTPIAFCLVNSGPPLEQTVRLYAPTTTTQAQTYCAGLGGAYSPV